MTDPSSIGQNFLDDNSLNVSPSVSNREDSKNSMERKTNQNEMSR